MPYIVDFRPTARKSLGKLPRRDQVRIVSAADALSQEPRPLGSRKLIAELNLWRIRVGSYLVIYQIEDDQLLILVVKIGHRKECLPIATLTLSAPQLLRSWLRQLSPVASP